MFSARLIGKLPLKIWMTGSEHYKIKVSSHDIKL